MQPHWIFALVVGTIISVALSFAGNWIFWRLQERRKLIDDRVSQHEFQALKKVMEDRLNNLEVKFTEIDKRSIVNTERIESLCESLEQHKAETRAASNRIEAQLGKIYETLMRKN